MRHRVRAHGAAEHEQDRREDGGLDHRKRDAEHDAVLRRIQDRRRLFKVRIHVAEDAADEDIRKRRIVQAEDHQAGEQALAEPFGHIYMEQGRQQSVGCAGNFRGIKQILPHDRKGPLRHDVGEDENGAQILSPGQVRAGDEKGEDAAIENGDHTGAHGEKHRVPKRFPQVGPGQLAGEEVGIVDDGPAAGLLGQMGVDRAGVDLERVLHDGDDRRDGGHRQHDAQQEQDHVIGLGKEGFDLVPCDRGRTCHKGRRVAHGVSPSCNEGRRKRARRSERPDLSRPPDTKRLRMRGNAPGGACLLFTQVQLRSLVYQPALYLSSISIQLPTVKAASAQYSGSSSTSLPVVVHQS